MQGLPLHQLAEHARVELDPDRLGKRGGRGASVKKDVQNRCHWVWVFHRFCLLFGTGRRVCRWPSARRPARPPGAWDPSGSIAGPATTTTQSAGGSRGRVRGSRMSTWRRRARRVSLGMASASPHGDRLIELVAPDAGEAPVEIGAVEPWIELVARP